MSLMIYRKEQVEVLESSGTLSKIRDSNDNEFSVRTTALHPLTVPRVPRSLQIMRPSDGELSGFERFIEYLRTPEANTLLHLEAQCDLMEFAVREQYRKMTGGEELVIGEGFHIAPSTAGKTGCEGFVTFTLPPWELPEEIKALMPQRAKKPNTINRISFVWLLIEQGFRVKRG